MKNWRAEEGTRRRRLPSVLAALFVLGQHLQLTTLAGFPVTLGLVLLPFLFVCITELRGLRRSSILLGTAVLCTPLTVAITANLSAGQSTSFLRTFALLAATVVMFVVSANSVLREGFDIASGLAFALIAISGLSFAQVVTGAGGSTALFNIYGDHQYLYQYDPLLQFNDLPRANGLYLEPSYNAFTILTCALILLLKRRYVFVAYSAGAVGVLAAQSATAFIALGLGAAVSLDYRRGRQAAVAVAVLSVGYVIIGSVLVERLSTLGTSGSSAHYRLIAPIKILRETIWASPLGAPLGSVESRVSAAGVFNGANLGSSLDNGYYLILYYFGFAGLMAIAFFCLRILARIRHFRASQSTAEVLTGVWILILPITSGGIFLPEFVGLTCVLLMALNSRVREPRPQGDGYESTFVRDHSDVSR